MSDGKRLIFYELNEVPLSVFDWFARARPRSSVARLLREGTVFETLAEDEGILSPWTTWPTLHRGVRNTQHCIFDFGQDLSAVNADFPTVWELLSGAGRKVGMFGSLHTYPLPADLGNYAFFVPDTFAAGPECFPERLSAFQEFNLAMVDRSGRNVGRGLPIRDAASFLARAPALGLRGATAFKLARQIASERGNKDRAVRRRTSQVQIAFDLFLKELKNTTPEAAFFFTNHVASSMHRYWPATFPKDYATKFWADGWDEKWSGEIPFTMSEADQQIADLMRVVERDPRYSLVILTSMGQAAVDEVERVETQLYLGDPRRFMRLLGIADDAWSQRRAMLPRYIFAVAPRLANSFTDQLQRFKINGQSVQSENHGEGVFMVKLGQANISEATAQITFDGRPVSFAEAGLANVKIQDEAGSNAYHIPQGSLIVYDPAQRRKDAGARLSVPTTEIAPAILRNFGVTPPAHMEQAGHIF